MTNEKQEYSVQEFCDADDDEEEEEESLTNSFIQEKTKEYSVPEYQKNIFYISKEYSWIL